MGIDTTNRPLERLDDDTTLMLRAAAGDVSAFEELYTRHLPSVASYLVGLGCWGVSVADVAQEAFARLWAARSQFDGHGKFKAYLFGFAHRVLLEERRRHLRIRTLADRLSRDRYRAVEFPEQVDMAAEQTELIERLGQALAQLTYEQQQALRLRYAEGMSLEEAAVTAGCTVKCLEGRLWRARKRLQCLMQRQKG